MSPKTSRSSRGKNGSVRTAKPRSASGALSGLIGAIAMSAVAGVLITAAVTPIVAVSGAAASSAISIFENLPNHLDPGQLAQPSTIYAKNSDDKNVEVATFYAQNREMVEWDDISQYVKDAAVAEEDPRFYTHGGVDVLATSRAVAQNLAGQNLSGASTVTMQYVRNVLVQEAESIPDEEEREAAYEDAMRQDMDRKLKEMRLAVSIEKQYSKDEILLGYLNISLFGRQIYGIESAAQYYYGKSAQDVSLAEAASLVATVNNPSLLQIDLEENIPANQDRRDKILDSMLSHGKITQAQHAEAIETPVEPNITPRVAGCAVAENQGLGHFCNYVQLYILNDPRFGNTPAEREFNFMRGGYDITTTIDLDIQKAGLEAMQANIPAQMEGIDIGGAGVSVEVGTGRVLGMVQNRPFSNNPDKLKADPNFTSINYNTDYDYGGSRGFQIGSTAKAFTLAEWVRTGHSVREMVNVDGRTVESSSFAAKCFDGGVYGYDSWKFQNDNLFTRGNQTVLTAIERSVNGGFVSMQQQMDLCDTFDLMERMGLHRASPLTNPDFSYLPNFETTDLTRVPSGVYAGSDEIAPITLASAYAGFAGEGKVCTPVPIDKITGPDGEEVPFTKSECTDAISPEVAAGTAFALESVVTNGLGGHARSSTGVPHLAKTGSSDSYVDNWTAGASSKVATVAWVGNVKGKVNTQFFRPVDTGDERVWPAMMNVADQKYGGDAFPEPSESALKQVVVEVPNVEGQDFDEAMEMLRGLGFNVTDGGDDDSSQAEGRVARTDPEAGASVSRGTGITLYRSNGSMTEVPDVTGMEGREAESALNSAGFSRIRLTCSGDGGNPGGGEVTGVSPGAGSDAKRDSQITVTVDCD